MVATAESSVLWTWVYLGAIPYASSVSAVGGCLSITRVVALVL